MAIAKALVERLLDRRKKIAAGGGEDKLEARRTKGLMTARDRIAGLFQEGTFLEFGMHVEHKCHNFGMEKKPIAADGVITGTGMIDGRPVVAYSQDFTAQGGSLGSMHAAKIVAAMDYAGKIGAPVVCVNDSGGARIQEAVEALSGYGKIFTKNVYLSGVVPQISVIAGPCAGGAAYSPALTDFLIMVRGSANMFICGPEVIFAATGQKCTMDEVGSAVANASISGNVHFIAENDQHALDITKKLLSFLPSNNVSEAQHKLDQPVDLADDAGMNEIMPEDPKQPFNVLDVIAHLVDDGDFLEVHRDFAKNIVVGFGRVQGVVSGFIANQPMVKAGTLDIDASDKGARFIRFCNLFNVPIVTLVDTGGFLPGIRQEQGGIIRHGAKMLFAYASATVPKITVIMRKAYGGAYLAMCSQDLGADFVYAWPSAEIAVMGAEGAARILFKREIDANPEKKAEIEADYRERFASPYQAACTGMLTDVIEPAETRRVLGLALRSSLSKREIRPAKKHGNIPL